jgi:glycosyltransferase involved in cell wall biosynthesis
VKVSIIIPYNIDRGYLKCAVQSVKNQLYQHIELIMACQPGYNCAQNINWGFKQSTGQFIKILAEDDMLPSNSIADLVTGMAGYDFISANAQYFGEVNYIDYGHITSLDEMLMHNQIHGGTVLYTRQCFSDSGGFDETLMTGEEYDFHLRLFSMGFRHGYINKLVHMYRVHPLQKSTWTNKEEKIKRHEYIQKIRDRYAC